MFDWKRLNHHPALAGLVIAIAGFVAVATIVAAIRQDSWEPVFATGWLPAVIAATLARTNTKACWPRLRGRAQH